MDTGCSMPDTCNEHGEPSIETLFAYTETSEYLFQYLLINLPGAARGGLDIANGLISSSQHHCGNLIVAGLQFVDRLTDVFNCFSGVLPMPSRKGNT